MDKKNKEFETIQNAIAIFKEGRFEEFKELLNDFLEADIADLFDELDEDEKIRLIKIIPNEKAAHLLDEMDAEDFEEYFGYLHPNKSVDVLSEMDNDDVADILGDLPEQKQTEIINLMDTEEAEEVRELLDYEEETAGGVMTKDFIAIMQYHTVKKAFEILRSIAKDAETIYYVYVIDDLEKLVGVISLRDLIVADENDLILDLMREKVVSVNVDTDREEVAQIVSKYGLLAIPVVDDEYVLKGIVTVDDIIEIIEEEATEDIYKIAGTTQEADFEEENPVKRIWSSLKSRLPWLIITLFGGFISTTIIQKFNYLLQRETILISFMPILAGMGGNVGTQSSTLTVRALAMGQITGKLIKNIFNEMISGLFMGVICGLGVMLLAFLMGGNPGVGILIGVSLCVNMVTAATVGTLVPIIFSKIGVDPAVASAPFITTAIDATGYTIYFILIFNFIGIIS